MAFKPDEIASVIKEEIKQFQSEIEVSEVGHVIEVGDGIARIHGLSNAMAGEMLKFENGVYGQVFNLEEDSIGAIILGDYTKIHEGFRVECTGEVLVVPCGDGVIGRVIGPLGNPKDGRGPLDVETRRPVESPAPGIADRQPVSVPMQTGIKAIDAMIPIGRGQRELIIGDRRTGKTSVALDAIINQKDSGVLCVYVAIGQKESTIASIVDMLDKAGAMKYTTVVVASSSDPAPLQYIAPYSGCSIAEHFMHQGKETLVVYDDLSKHAVAYREVSLLLSRPPGREAFPGDVFYLHSRLLERAAKLSDDLGAGSLTALPIIETQEGEVSAYIPTNVISITDGQIYLVPDLFFAGVRPAIDVGISVSRVGGNAQIKAMKKVAGALRLDLAAYRELEAFAQLGTELDDASERKLARGRRMVEVLKQGLYQPYNVIDQVVIIFAGYKGLLDDVTVSDLAEFEKGLIEFVHDKHQSLWDDLAKERALTKEIDGKLSKAITEFKQQWKP